ncbi:MAG: YebC/PmpR family DNA-binding transcriptional regulator [bacterium]
MSGHSKWAGIKHRKAAVDAKRGQIFSKIIREITMAARQGGGDSAGNPRLRVAVDKARSVNMPQDNIKKAIKRGTGELPGVTYEELVYEGYGPGGVAVLVEVTTDNKNRATAEVRKTFSRHGGNLGDAGCVGWMFNKKGYISVDKNKIKEEELIEISLESGAEDVKADDEDLFEIITQPRDFEKVKRSLQEKNIEINSAEITMLPQTYIKLEGTKAEQMLRLMDDLDNNDDVQNVYANFDIPKEIMEKVS